LACGNDATRPRRSMVRHKQPLPKRICTSYWNLTLQSQRISSRRVYRMYARSNPLEAAQVLFWLEELDKYHPYFLHNPICIPPGWEEVLHSRTDCDTRCGCNMPHYDACYARKAEGREPDPCAAAHDTQVPPWTFDGEIVADTMPQAWLAYASDAMATSLFDLAAQSLPEAEVAHLRATVDESVAHRVMAVRSAHAQRPWVAFAAALGDASADTEYDSD